MTFLNKIQWQSWASEGIPSAFPSHQSQWELKVFGTLPAVAAAFVATVRSTHPGVSCVGELRTAACVHSGAAAAATPTDEVTTREA